MNKIRWLILCIFYPDVVNRLRDIQALISLKDYYKNLCQSKKKKKHPVVKEASFSNSICDISLNNESK